MKTLILFILCFWLLPVLPACDEATPEYPITIVNDVVYLALYPGDSHSTLITNDFCVVRVWRPYGENATIEFDEWYDEEINHVHISRGTPENAYP